MCESSACWSFSQSTGQWEGWEGLWGAQGCHMLNEVFIAVGTMAVPLGSRHTWVLVRADREKGPTCSHFHLFEEAGSNLWSRTTVEMSAWIPQIPQIPQLTMRNQHTTLCRISILERKCTDRAVKLCSALEGQLSSGTTSSDMWDKTVSFFTIKRAPIFHNGYSKSSREAMRRFPSPAEDVAPLCCQ
ncbi:unnamed protein product [Menidia menidia]|uniref:(Atlantic silverside) hypothetical protein n=1 Tax=Menidia menidia TaxID=238744 RepID=A0A8S4C1T5_9TELE|nr:unnamed protein product [Menidia menidia]